MDYLRSAASSAATHSRYYLSKAASGMSQYIPDNAKSLAQWAWSGLSTLSNNQKIALFAALVGTFKLGTIVYDKYGKPKMVIPNEELPKEMEFLTTKNSHAFLQKIMTEKIYGENISDKISVIKAE